MSDAAFQGKVLASRIYPELFLLGPADAVLHAGCGEGAQVAAYGARGGGRVVLLDVQKERVDASLARAKEAGLAHAEGVVGDLEVLPFPNATFDKIVAVDIIQHVRHPEKVLAEFARVLKPGGEALVTFPALQHWLLTAWGRMKRGAPAGGWNPDVFNHNRAPWAWGRLLRASHLRVVRAAATTLWPPLHRWGVKRFWFSNSFIHAVDRALGSLPVVRTLGQATVCVVRKPAARSIAYLANLRFPTEKAHGVQIVQMCASFERAGCDVTLVAPFRFRSRALRGIEPFAHYGVRPFKVATLPSLDAQPLASLLRILDTPAFALQYGSFLAFVWAWLRMVMPADATVYTRDSRLARLALGCTANVFLELHTLPKADDIATARRVRGVIAVTQGIAAVLTDAGILAERVVVAPDAVDLAAYDLVSASPRELRRVLGLPLDAALIGYAGRLTTFGAEKGVPELLAAFAALDPGPAKLRLMILGGDAGEAARYRATLDTLRIAPRVHFLPRVAPTEVPRFLKAMDVLVAPFPRGEHYERAMSPLKVFEYAASGRPMVLTDLESIRGVVPADAAAFAQPGDAQDLARALREALIDAAGPRALARRARTIAERHTWDARTRALLGFMAGGGTA